MDTDLWDRVQAQLKEKAPPRKRPKNDSSQALLRGLIIDAEGRPVVPTYATKGTRRYSFYETRKDRARPGDPAPARYQQGVFDRHLIEKLSSLLRDEHALRRISGIEEAGKLRALFASAQRLVAQLGEVGSVGPVLRALVATLQIGRDNLAITLKPDAFGIEADSPWNWSIPLPVKRPFRESTIRIDADGGKVQPDNDLLELIADAMAVQRLALASPELSLNQLGKREGRCRTHLSRLLRIAWLSPNILEAIVKGAYPGKLNRKSLLSSDIPIDWAEQERLFGFAV